jgi:hypothetical protein
MQDAGIHDRQPAGKKWGESYHFEGGDEIADGKPAGVNGEDGPIAH